MIHATIIIDTQQSRRRLALLVPEASHARGPGSRAQPGQPKP